MSSKIKYLSELPIMIRLWLRSLQVLFNSLSLPGCLRLCCADVQIKSLRFLTADRQLFPSGIYFMMDRMPHVFSVE